MLRQLWFSFFLLGCHSLFVSICEFIVRLSYKDSLLIVGQTVCDLLIAIHQTNMSKVVFSFQDQKIDEEFELLVLASDGLWDVVPNEVSVPTHHLSPYYKHTCTNAHEAGSI